MQPMSQPMQQPAYGQPMGAQQGYGQPVMAVGEPMIPQHMMMPFIMTLLGSIFLMIGGGLIIGNVFGVLCLIFVILIVVTKNRTWAMLTWIFALIGMIIAIAALALNALAWAAISTWCGFGTYLQTYCESLATSFLIGLVLNVVLGIVGGILAFIGARKLQALLPATVAPMFAAPMQQQPMYQQPMQQQPMYQQQPGYQQPLQQQPMSQQPVQAAPVAAAVQPMAQPSSKFCKSCGQAVVAGAMFCPSCGSRY